MSQSKRQSVMESVAQQLTGYFVGLGTQYIVFPLYGMEIDLITNLQIGAIFAIVSTVRSYLLRRAFNKRHTTSPVEVLQAALNQRDELLLELRDYNVGLQVENREMQEYIRKIDGIPN